MAETRTASVTISRKLSPFDFALKAKAEAAQRSGFFPVRQTPKARPLLRRNRFFRLLWRWSFRGAVLWWRSPVFPDLDEGSRAERDFRRKFGSGGVSSLQRAQIAALRAMDQRRRSYTSGRISLKATFTDQICLWRRLDSLGASSMANHGAADPGLFRKFRQAGQTFCACAKPPETSL
jgi:hypothetical protein